MDESALARDRTSLDKAHELKQQANKAYTEKDYTGAIRLYHRCLLYAKAVTQLTATGLQDLARDERALGSDAGSPQSSTSEAGTSESASEKPAAQRTGKMARSRMDSTARGEEMKTEAQDLIAKCYNNLAACIVNGPQRNKEDYLRAVSYCDKALELEKGNEKALFRKGQAFQKAEKYDRAGEIYKQCQQSAQITALIEECRVKEVEQEKQRDAAIRANFAKHRAAARNVANADGGMMNGNPPVNGNVPGH